MARWPYCTARWQALREQVLSEEPLCRYCLEMGQLSPSEHVDHIKPVRTHTDLAFTRDNLQGLCAPCHDGVKQREEKAGHRIGVGIDGVPVDENHHWSSS
jgi:5-methylcytosine-specific restriction protein A